jgi:hypothetical protein
MDPNKRSPMIVKLLESGDAAALLAQSGHLKSLSTTINVKTSMSKKYQ